MLDERELTIAITHYMRDDDLREANASIKQHLPAATILTQDTHGNLSWGRNRLMQRVQTPYVFLMEEDMRWGDEIDLQAMHELLHVDLPGKQVLMVSLALQTKRGRIVSVACNFKDTELHDAEDVIITANKHKAIVCEYCANAWLAKTHMVKPFQWNERLRLGEHEEYFWRIKQSTSRYAVLVHNGKMLHLGSRPSKAYSKQRERRAEHGLNKAAKIIGKPFEFYRSFHAWQRVKRKPARLVPLVSQSESESIERNVTFGITYYMRAKELTKCITSIKRQYPNARIDIEDTAGNLSAARNRLVERCTTPYYFMLEEDMRLLRRQRLPQLMDVLHNDGNLLGVSGGLYRSGQMKACAGTYCRGRHNVQILNAQTVSTTTIGTPYIRCWHVYNFGLFRTDYLRQYKWDERLEMGEHYDFFYRLFLQRKHPVACTDYIARHVLRRPTEYNRQRKERLYNGDLRFEDLHKKKLVGSNRWNAHILIEQHRRMLQQDERTAKRLRKKRLELMGA